MTAYSTLEEDVFVAPCVVTTNDNFMGRTEKRLALLKGPTIRRGARVGGGAILCPGVEVGEEAFVGAGAVVTKDVPPRKVVVGSPARVIRDVPDDELLSYGWAPERAAHDREPVRDRRGRRRGQPGLEEVPARLRPPSMRAARAGPGSFERRTRRSCRARSETETVSGRQSASATFARSMGASEA